jgi:hypothetical protein
MFCKSMNLFKIVDTGGGGDGEVLIEQLRSWQLPHRRERCYFIGEAEGGWEGGGFTGLATTAASPQFTTEIYNSV